MLTLAARAAICLLVPNVIFYLAYRKKPEYSQCLTMVDFITKGRTARLTYLLGRR